MRKLLLSATLVLLATLTLAAPASAATCTDMSSGTATEPPAWVDTTMLGDQPAGYELWAPEGPVRGVMIGIHGGGWETTGPAQLSALHYQAQQWLDRGFAFANFDYRICGQSLPDVETLHDALRTLVRDVPFCVLGESAGAHLALLLAADRPDSISCVIAGAPPANADLLAQSNPNLAAVWQDAFGPAWDTTYNPAHRVDDIKARVLAGVSTGDTIINPAQVRSLEGPGREALVLDGQPNGWYYPHANITGPAHDLYESRVAALIAPYTGSYTVPWGRPAAPAPIPQPVVAPAPVTTAPAPVAAPPVTPTVKRPGCLYAGRAVSRHGITCNRSRYILSRFLHKHRIVRGWRCRTRTRVSCAGHTHTASVARTGTS